MPTQQCEPPEPDHEPPGPNGNSDSRNPSTRSREKEGTYSTSGIHITVIAVQATRVLGNGTTSDMEHAREQFS